MREVLFGLFIFCLVYAAPFILCIRSNQKYGRKTGAGTVFLCIVLTGWIALLITFFSNKTGAKKQAEFENTNNQSGFENIKIQAETGRANNVDMFSVTLINYARGFLPFCFDKLETQRERVYTVIDAFGVSDVFEMSLSLHLSVLNKRRPLGNCSLDDFERDTWSRIDRMLGTLDEEYIKNNFRTKDTYTLIRCLSILSYYNTVYGNYHSLNTYNNNIVSVIRERGFIIPENPLTESVQIIGGNIHIFSGCLLSFMQKHQEIYADFRGSLFLKEKEPVISLYEDGKKTAEYRLQTEAGEDFSGKYYQYCVRIVFEQYSGVNHPVPVVIIDGFISDTPDDRSMSADDVGFRIEVHYLECGGEGGKKIYEDSFGRDLVCKGLKASNRTIPSNVRLIGVCPACGKSFAFHAYSLYMAQSDIAYSDDGLDCCEIIEEIDKETWSYAENGKVFRYYNSFVCPHCKTPYFDYKTHPESKFFGVPGCVHLGRELYRSK